MNMLSPLRRWLVRGRRWFLGLLFASILLYAWARWASMDPLFQAPCSTVLLDRHGELLSASAATDGQWRFPPGDSVPARFATCLLQFEDRHFREHHGIHIPSLIRAMRQNQRAGRTVSGGSTLTMQVARMSHGPASRTYWAKLQEALLALRIETRYSKQEILALYTANAPFGGNVVGLDAAAWRWYGKPAHHLTWSACATLAVLPNAPSELYPGKGHEALRAKRDRLLDRLLAIGTIDTTEWSLAKEEPLPEKPLALPQLAPHLLATLSRTGHAGERLSCTVDGHLQRRATEVAERYSERLRANEVHNAAAIIVDVATGEVRAYVGNLPSAGIDHAGSVDIVRARRSTGSVLKPFLYADMLQSGELLPDMLVADIPTQYDGFTPRNYDEHFSGAVPASEALARSLNVPAVRALRTHGIARTLNTFHALGLHSIDRSADDYGLSLILGGAECTLWELAGAYASMARTVNHFGRGGERYHQGDIHAPILFPVTAAASKKEAEPVLSASAIWLTLRALREVNRPMDEQGWKMFADQQNISWKTGTSFGHRDAWAIGVTDRWCVAVWTGNASGEGRPGLTGTLASAPLLFDLFALLPAGHGFDAPHDEMVRAPLCHITGFRATVDCERVDTVLIPPQGMRSPLCPFHHRIMVDATGSYRVPDGTGRSVSWFTLPPAMELFYAQRTPGYRALPPLRSGSMESDVTMEVLYPERNARLLIPVEMDGTRGQAVIEVAHRDVHATVHWDLDGTYLGSTVGEHRMAISPADGPHELTLTDGDGHMLRHPFRSVSSERH